MSAHLGTAERPLRVAIVGAGPAGFYAAEALLKQKDLVCRIDFFNRLPTPYGLVREGVAPDHQSIKAVTRVYDKLAAGAGVRYFGNVTFGRDLHHADLKAHYDQIVYAVGAQSDRKMGIPGEDLAGSMPATIFVGWYNGHPDYRELSFNLDHERVIVVGNGNVAMDVTRILVSDPDELAKTDMADHAIAALRSSKVREVVMLGRRGPAQAAFTNPELKEFGELAGVDVIVDPADLALDPQSEASLANDKTALKNVELLRTYAARGATGAPRRIVMRFLASPVEVLGADGQMTAVKVERNQLIESADGTMRPKGTGNYDTLEAGMILRSVGYKGVPLPGVPYNSAKGTIPNVEGRVTDQESNAVIPGEYVVGWAKRGPSGVIGTNKPDAAATVVSMLADLPNLPAAPADRDVATLLAERAVDVVTYADWKLLDAHESAQGQAQGRPRVKVTCVTEMMAIIHAGRNTA
ncbi:FAD-dependent oxidoreductase [Candidatus Viridilinea mediisalina]|uniref:ferredoxin--NADP(+) reductase n=1 Tax=Candidatus Viridilinea mediisalina TaxID=2024553 RepID=A0A2A6RF95_9CHLR|nr:FAD-dependent oxidoreductase [Candidatus Viridilinea mediisalina]PDW01556.1 NADP oxidoreductase [Candidatus Viridilinea mediisalina]